MVFGFMKLRKEKEQEKDLDIKQEQKKAPGIITPTYGVLVFLRKVSTILLNCSGY